MSLTLEQAQQLAAKYLALVKEKEEKDQKNIADTTELSKIEADNIRLNVELVTANAELEDITITATRYQVKIEEQCTALEGALKIIKIDAEALEVSIKDANRTHVNLVNSIATAKEGITESSAVLTVLRNLVD